MDRVIYRDYTVNQGFFIYCSLASGLTPADTLRFVFVFVLFCFVLFCFAAADTLGMYSATGQVLFLQDGNVPFVQVLWLVCMCLGGGGCKQTVQISEKSKTRRSNFTSSVLGFYRSSCDTLIRYNQNTK